MSSSPYDTTVIAESYDYIVCGGGTSGCVLASRLSEDKNVTVLLLEAGVDDRHINVQVPAFVPNLQKDPQMDWMYRTERQENYGNRTSVWPRGKMLGGCSSNNYMLWVRGNRAEYDLWEQQYGCEGWGYDKILPLYKKIEDAQFDPTYVKADPAYRGTKGELRVRGLNYGECTHRFVKAGQEQGIAFNPDYNGKDQLGMSYAQFTIADGKRQTSASAYIHPIAEKRKNLTVACRAQVTKVLVENDKCVGVVYHRPSLSSPEKTVKCRKEVILCGGAVGSPAILLLSGIGPRAELEKLGIPVVKDLPGVGKNLQDHLFVGLAYQITKPITMDEAVFSKYPHRLLLAFAQYFLFGGKGPLSSQALECMSFHKTRPELNWPDLQIHFVNTGAATGDSGKVKEQFELEIEKFPGVDYGVTILPSLLHPQSKGEVVLASSSPAVKPVIVANYLSHEEDMRVLVEGLKIGKKIILSKAFDDVRGIELVSEEVKKVLGDNVDTNSDAYYREVVRRSALTIYHPVGTCSMGKASDPMAVCDAKLQVRGIAGLRVADCSVLPTLPSGNTQAPAYLVGEKAAEIILSRPPQPSSKL